MSGSTGVCCPPTSRICRSSTAASSSATGSSRPCGRAAGEPTELAEHVTRLRGSASGLGIALPADRRPSDRHRPRRPAGGRGPRRARRRRVGPHHGLARPVPRPGPPSARRGRGGHDRHPGLAGGAAAGRPPRARPASRRLRGAPRPRQPARGAQDDLARRLRLRAARGPTRRRRRRPVPHHRRPPVRGHDARTSSSSAADPTVRRSSRRRRSTARSCRARRAAGCWPGAPARACGRSRAG